MWIKRIDSDRNISKIVDIIDIQIRNKTFRLTEQFGELHIALDDMKSIAVIPHCANEISITTRY